MDTTIFLSPKTLEATVPNYWKQMTFLFAFVHSLHAQLLRKSVTKC